MEYLAINRLFPQNTNNQSNSVLKKYHHSKLHYLIIPILHNTTIPINMNITSFLYNISKIILILTLPFLLLIRGAVWAHEALAIHAWLSVGVGTLLAALLLMAYFFFFYGQVTGKVSDLQTLKRSTLVALVLVGGFALNGVLYISNTNTKTTQVQKEFRSLHPILRLSVSTIIFLDSDLIVTDAKRQPEDYRKMGLPSKKRSLHYKQSDGYVHALDIRVNGRTEVRNFLLKWYFKGMGFNVLRHGGTGDHLHISLSSRDLPGAI